MKFFDHSLKAPEDNLACDEALLDLCENGGLPGGLLRFWESESPFVVLGYSNKAASEVLLDACSRARIPVLRRPSGGGTVLQGPGCLNYALVLEIAHSSSLKTLTSTNDWILKQHRDALAPHLPGETSVQGTSDLTWNGLKVSGNAQRRKKNALLFHGTFLYGFDAAAIEKYLALPSRQPDYRKNRPHREFVANLPLDREKIKSALKDKWNASEKFEEIPKARIKELVRDQYSRQEWNFKF